MNNTDIEQIITAVQGYFPVLAPEEQKIAVQIYQLLATGTPVSRQQLADGLQVPLGKITATLDRWWGIQFDTTDRVIGFWGLTLQPTVHRLYIDEKQLYTWCAWDTLFVPLILGVTAQIESRCPVNNAQIHLTVAPDKVTAINPDSAILSFLTPADNAVKDDIVTNFCHYIFFMSSRDAGAQWIKAHPDTFLMSMEDAFILGQRIIATQYADVIDH